METDAPATIITKGEWKIFIFRTKVYRGQHYIAGCNIWTLPAWLNVSSWEYNLSTIDNGYGLAVEEFDRLTKVWTEGNDAGKRHRVLFWLTSPPPFPFSSHLFDSWSTHILTRKEGTESAQDRNCDVSLKIAISSTSKTSFAEKRRVLYKFFY